MATYSVTAVVTTGLSVSVTAAVSGAPGAYNLTVHARRAGEPTDVATAPVTVTILGPGSGTGSASVGFTMPAASLYEFRAEDGLGGTSAWFPLPVGLSMARVAVHLEDVLGAVESRLAVVVPQFAGAGKVFLTLNPDDCPLEGMGPVWGTVSFDQFQVTPESETFEVTADDPPVVDGEILVGVWWDRLQLDQPGRHDHLLKDQAKGVAVATRKAVAALHGYDPVNGSGDYLLMTELRFRGVKRIPGKDGVPRHLDLLFWTQFFYLIDT